MSAVVETDLDHQPFASTNPTSKGKYRPEIDGLRAFAVVAVIINHFNKDLLPSGYLGVDIFFVISGYVITSSLSGRQSKNFLDFVTGFYERRVKRLVPALVVFVLITSLLICLFKQSTSGALQLGSKSLFGMSNISLFKSSSDYFSESAELNPFTHTWSLGVEEQFYLLFPFLIWFTGFARQSRNGARNLFLSIGVLAIASLIRFIYLYPTNQPAAYFLMPPRFWELSAGCLVFIGYQKRAKVKQVLEQVPPLIVIAAMVGVMFLPNSAAVPATISIVVLSAILLACLKSGTAAFTAFTNRGIVYVGLISYSLYLWHWAVLCISRWTIGIHWWSAPIQTVAMLLIASASYEWVEKTTKRAAPGRKYLSIMIGISSLSLSAFAIKLLSLAPKDYLYMGSPHEAYMSSNPAYNGKIPYEGVKSSRSQKLIVLGNSYAGHLLPLIKEIADKHLLAYKVIMTARPQGSLLNKAIPSINGSEVKAGKTSQVASATTNPDLNRHLIQKAQITPSTKLDKETVQVIRELNSGDVLLLSSRHFSLYKKLFVHKGNRYYQTLKGDRGESLDKKGLIFTWKSKLRQIIQSAGSKNASVVFFAPLPEFQSEVSSELCSKEWFRYAISKNCYLTEERKPMITTRYLPEMKETLGELKEEYSNFHVFDPFTALCPTSRRVCSPLGDGGMTFSDSNHLSVRGALLLVKPFDEFLASHSLLKH